MRRFTHVLTLLLLLPTVIAVSIWALSYTEYRCFGIQSHARSPSTSVWLYSFVGYGSYKGRLTIGQISERNYARRQPPAVPYFSKDLVLGNFSALIYAVYHGERWGFGLYRPNATRLGSFDVDHTGWAVTVPCWFVTLLTAPLSALGIRRTVTRLKRRHVDGVCFNCGYDLRATPERCPECGAVPQTNSEVLSNPSP